LPDTMALAVIGVVAQQKQTREIARGAFNDGGGVVGRAIVTTISSKRRSNRSRNLRMLAMVPPIRAPSLNAGITMEINGGWTPDAPVGRVTVAVSDVLIRRGIVSSAGRWPWAEHPAESRVRGLKRPLSKMSKHDTGKDRRSGDSLRGLSPDLFFFPVPGGCPHE
jgi:hypothetical protein